MEDRYKEELLSLMREMGDKRFKKYMEVYITQSKKKFDLEEFLDTFHSYIEHRKSKSKDGCAVISISNFRFYLNGTDLEDLYRQIEEVNSKVEDFHYDYE